MPGTLSPLAAALLPWYQSHQRPLPFRGAGATAYHVWVSEIMGQQTRMDTLVPYYERFVAALPGVQALAAAPEDALHKLWEGLGYYSRVRNMQRAAQLVVAQHGGQLPASYTQLLALPGVGEYTAGAIASIAFGLPEVAVDGNVLRVFARLMDCHDDIALPATRRAIAERVRQSLPQSCPGDYNQALMELGALVCLPKAPRCGACPVAALCAAQRAGTQAALPVKAKKPPQKTVPVTVLVLRRDQSEVLLHRRGQRGLLAGLWEPVVIEGAHLGRRQAAEAAAALVPGTVVEAGLPDARHVFTHRVWQMRAFLCRVPAGAAPPAGDYVFATAYQLGQQYALPGAFRAYLPAMRGPTP